jgi:Transposase and inactivated derivatives
MARIKRDPKTVALAQEIVKQFNPQTVQDADEALKVLFGPIFESLLQGEMEHHLGCKSNDKGYKATQNRRNGYTNKTVHTTKGDINIDVPRDRDASFEPQIIPKRKKDVSEIKSKVLAM